MLKTRFSAFILTAMFAVCGAVQADQITWQTSVAIEDTGAFVDQTGTLVLALNADNAMDDSTIGGVTFAGTDLAGFNGGVTAGGVTLTSNAPNGNFGSTFVQGGGPPPTITDTNINNLIASGIWNPQTVTLSGLTAGDSYFIQIIGNDSRNGRNSTTHLTVLGDGVNGAAGSLTAGTAGLNALTQTIAGAGDPALPGNAITGSFVPTGSTITFEVNGSTDGGTTLSNNGRAQINGIQLRTIAVPEPSSLALLGLGAIGFLSRRRR